MELKTNKPTANHTLNTKRRQKTKIDFSARGFLAHIRHFFDVIKKFILNLNEDTVFTLWIIVLILAGTVFWGMSVKPRALSIANAANRVLAGAGDTRSLGEPISLWRLPGPASTAGVWYTMPNRELALIFPVFNGGVFNPCVAIFTNEGKIDTFLPLSPSGQISMERASNGFVEAQKAHAEKAASLIIRKMYGGGL
ncbi:MAG: hypothetical protein LBG74_01415 [Spirochaetaceae bacterium]|jgi:hypothetical protein|nr:hypothetical protein [Spirochaetaceae bacterium]